MLLLEYFKGMEIQNSEFRPISVLFGHTVETESLLPKIAMRLSVDYDEMSLIGADAKRLEKIQTSESLAE